MIRKSDKIPYVAKKQKKGSYGSMETVHEKNSLISCKQKALYIGALIAGIAYSMFVFYLCRFTGLDADKANHILQAQDILQGNFWFKDWNLTGITFFTTDLLYYELAVLITGSIGYRTAMIAYGFMVLSVIAVSMFAVFSLIHENRKPRMVLFIFLFAIPCINYLGWLRIHSGAICWSVIAILIAANILKDGYTEVSSKRDALNYIFVFLSLLLGITGDLLTALEGAAPILLYCLITILNSSQKYDIKSDKRTYLIISVLAAIAGAITIDRLYFFWGGANRNSYLGYHSFSSVKEWRDKVWSFFSNLLLMGDAGFMGERLNDIWSYTKIINGFIVFVGVVLVIWKICRLIRGRNVDAISAILSISFVIIACAYIFTNRNHFKYMTIEPMICYIVVLREYDNIISFMKNRRCWICLIYVLAVISFAGKVEAIMHYNYPEEVVAFNELTTFLEEHDLHYGYASFWNASVISVVSNNKVNVRHIMRDSWGRFTMYNWFNKNQWYLEDTNFILIENTSNDRGADDGSALSEDNVFAYFGAPIERYECSGYIVMVYDHNLSKYLVGIEDGKIIPYEMFCNDKVDSVGEGVDKVFHLHKDGVVFGPYINIVPGKYSLVFEGDALDKVRVDVYSNSESLKEKEPEFVLKRDINYQENGEKLPKFAHDLLTKSNISFQLISQENNSIVVEFEIDNINIGDVEFRVFCDEDVDVRLDQISISKVR